MISVIIPTYNEEKAIKSLLDCLASNHNIEVIVVDGGSQDRTREFAQQFTVKVIECAKNRALQMNEGVKQAKGDTLLFLHADSVPENKSLNLIDENMRDGFVGGCLSQSIDSRKKIYRLIESSGNIRAKISRIFYGDQAIFVRRDVFLKIGGFDAVELFEDVLFSKKLRRIGKTSVLPCKIFCSPRRWERQGVIKATFTYWILSLGFMIGVSHRSLKKVYGDIR